MIVRRLFNKIDRLPLREQIAQEISNAIFRGDLSPGDKIPEHSLAEQFGVSRLPVREAIRILEQQNLLLTVPKAGTYIKKPTANEFYDGMRVRSALEDLAVQHCIEKLDDAQWATLYAKLEDEIAAMREAADREDWANVIRLDNAWHFYIIEAAQNQVLLDSWQNLGLLTIIKTVGKMTPESEAQTVPNHEKLLDVLRQQNLEACREAFRSHILLTVP